MADVLEQVVHYDRQNVIKVETVIQTHRSVYHRNSYYLSDADLMEHLDADTEQLVAVEEMCAHCQDELSHPRNNQEVQMAEFVVKPFERRSFIHSIDRRLGSYNDIATVRLDIAEYLTHPDDPALVWLQRHEIYFRAHPQGTQYHDVHKIKYYMDTHLVETDKHCQKCCKRKDVFVKIAQNNVKHKKKLKGEPVDVDENYAPERPDVTVDEPKDEEKDKDKKPKKNAEPEDFA